MPPEQITVTAFVNASPDTAWEAYTRPKHITRWNFASDDWCCPSASNDLRVGGTYKARMEAKDGSFGFDLVMIYDAVETGESFTSTMENGRQVTTTFAPEADGTLVSTRFDPETEHPIEMQRDGWQAILNNYKSYAESL
ncbi:activator of HSP90 ATPase [Oceanicola sp. 22II-s10i]|uniref:SRPBCC family protein n=1 Tax=Oceanicola sp. 22II-s10i TaxID=1317116 RepID=UPI000B649477|nr:SRPBCC family protein [Oceanicola sp. 22II-s10i]OWU84039.1 activator of HSP90 ATPase [Oceanicola sp. 22II-s10i]